MSVTAAEPPWELLARHLAGEAAPHDEAAVRAWQAAAPANAALWQQLTGVWAETGAGAASIAGFGAADTAQAWQKFETSVMGPPPAPPAPPAPSVPPASVPPISSGVLGGFGKAALLLVAGAGAGWLLRTAVPPAAEAPVPTRVAAVTSAPVASVAPAAEVDLVFEDAPVAEVAQRLERAFTGSRVEVTDSLLAGQRFTGVFRGARLKGVLGVVAVATGATIHQRPDSTWVLVRTAD